MNRPAARDRLASFCERHFTVLHAAVFVALLVLAWLNHFVQDDAFIAFRYADHLARGQGLVFNLGERVEGYTCFLHVLLIAAGIRLGFDPIAFSYAIGMASFAGTLWAAFGLARTLSGSRLIALAALVLLGTNYTFSAFATGGLETQLHTFLVTAFLHLGARILATEPRAGSGAARLALCSLIGALAILTRLDALPLILPMGLVLAWDAFARVDRWREAALRWLALLLPAALLLGAWTAWKLAYYGALLPNTFYVKVESRASLAQGLYYLYRFVTTAAGAIPYYSRLTTIDMLGLNDRWIAQHGLTRHATPGHRRQPTLDYLLERRVNLMLGHPRLVWEETPGPLYVQEYPVPRYVAGLAEGRKFPAGLKALEIPIDRGYRLVVLYLTPSPAVDRAIREHGWRVREVADRDAPQ